MEHSDTLPGYQTNLTIRRLSVYILYPQSVKVRQIFVEFSIRMEFSSNQFEIIINLSDERARDTGQTVNDSPKSREFPEFGFSNADVLGHGLRHFAKLPSVPDVREEDESEIRNEKEAGKLVRVVNGSDVGDIPIEYRIEGLADFELPVKGKILRFLFELVVV